MSVETTMPWSWDSCARGWEGDPENGGEHDYGFEGAQIEGDVPPTLRGTFLRNGPGAMDVHGTALKHPIDGDGLVCRITFPSDGPPHFRSRFVQSRHRSAEAASSRLTYRGQMGTMPTDFSRLHGVMDTAAMLLGRRKHLRHPFRNPSNTNVFYWGGKLVTSYETHPPHHLDPVTLETLGLDDFDGALKPVRTLAAHFRLDPSTGNLVTVSAKPSTGTHQAVIMFSEFDSSWNLLRQQTHHVDGLNYVHDFALTPNYFIVQMTPFVSIDRPSVLKILAGLRSPGELMRHYPNLPSRLVLIPRWKGDGAVEDAPSLLPIQVDDLSPVHIFHFGSAHDTDDGLECTAVCLPEAFDMTWQNQVWLSNAMDAPGRLCRYEIKLNAPRPSLSRIQIDESSCEFPTADPRRHGLPQRFVYLMANATAGQNLPYRAIVKCATSLDRQDERQVWQADGIVGEPVFAPRGESSSNGDEGWLLVQLYQPEAHKTQLVVLDAQHVDAGPVCRLHLPHHLPFSFHATFTQEILGAD